MGQRFGRIIAANSAATKPTTTITTTPIIPYVCKQTPQQQIATISTLDCNTITHHTTQVKGEEQYHINTIVPTSSGSTIATIKPVTTPTTINGHNIITAGCNSNSDVNVNKIQKQEEEEEEETVSSNYNSNGTNNHLLSINNLSSSGGGGGAGAGAGADAGAGGGDRQIYIKIQLTKMESANDLTITGNNIPSPSISCGNGSDSAFYGKQLNNTTSSNISEEIESELIDVNSIATATTETTDNNCNIEGISKNSINSDSIAVNIGLNAIAVPIPNAYIENDRKMYNLTINRTCTEETINNRCNNNNRSPNNNNNNNDNNISYNDNSLCITQECDSNNEWQQACLHNHKQQEEQQNKHDHLNGKEMADYCTVLLTDDLPINNPIENLRSTTNKLQLTEKVDKTNFCCRRRRSKSAMSRMTQSIKKVNEATISTHEMTSMEASNRRCCKYSCRDVFWRILDPAASRLTMKSLKQYRVNKEKSESEHSKYNINNNTNKNNKNNNNSIKNARNEQECIPESRTNSKNFNKTLQPQCRLTLNCNERHSNVTATSISPPLSSSTTTTMYNQNKPPVTTITRASPPSLAALDDDIGSTAPATSTTIATVPNQLLIQAVPTTVDVDVALDDSCSRGGAIGPTSTPQFVIVQCAIVNATDVITKQPPQVSKLVAAATIIAGVSANHHLPITTSTISSCLNNTPSISSSIHDNLTKQLIATTTVTNVTSKVDKAFTGRSCNTIGSTPTVHSQVDFRHFLVPDLERITSASFYWGKMDRYEAERLLDDKSEGTFLLRDSAQEEFLFSVSFRKYGRSLHARIEQSGHRFSFDCHDPGVYTAPTVMGLLEHYKDPTCVMFFEPMLTTPLNREFCFSLQQLCRATIVSNISTYDGISELDLPARMKLYLKEYHYKQKLRVKPFDELLYAASCT